MQACSIMLPAGLAVFWFDVPNAYPRCASTTHQPPPTDQPATVTTPLPPASPRRHKDRAAGVPVAETRRQVHGRGQPEGGVGVLVNLHRADGVDAGRGRRWCVVRPGTSFFSPRFCCMLCLFFSPVLPACFPPAPSPTCACPRSFACMPFDMTCMLCCRWAVDMLCWPVGCGIVLLLCCGCISRRQSAVLASVVTTSRQLLARVGVWIGVGQCGRHTQAAVLVSVVATSRQLPHNGRFERTADIC